MSLPFPQPSLLPLGVPQGPAWLPARLAQALSPDGLLCFRPFGLVSVEVIPVTLTRNPEVLQ